MLEGKQLIIATRKYAKEDRAKSWKLTLSTLVLLLAAYSGAIVNVHIVPQLICATLAGLLTVRMFIIYHDYLHQTILQNSKIANILFTLYGMYILAPTSIWKRTHDYHHAHNSKLYTSSIGSFPLVTKKDFLAASKQEQRIYLFIRHPFTISFGYFFAFLWGMCLRSLIKGSGKHFDSFLALLFHYSIGLTILMLFGVQSFLIGFLLPSFLGSAIGAYLFYAQHNFPTAKYKSKEEWDYVYAAMYSSSYMKMNKVMHWFTGNIGYHHIHHINSKIPFYKLPHVFSEIEEFQHPNTTSLLPVDIYKCFQVKVWDPEQSKMLGLKELYN
ncbi:MAG: fatty acid desaturase [Saprospiraceae bacterium]|nr:MAG: fatty acid desaturase [Saprospiraceae bacterium]